VRWPVPELDEGPHLSYTVQWFSFALIILVGTFILLRKQAREVH
jgi:cytochrome oxidase assembly protein ShyY1